jgi:hypothetical protein
MPINQMKLALSPDFTQDNFPVLDGPGFFSEAANRERAVGSARGHVGQHGWISRPRRTLTRVRIRGAPRVI